MSARSRSTRPSTAATSSRTQSTTQAAIPIYSAPSAPLNARAISEIERLPANSRYATKIKDLQAAAIEHLTSSATIINEIATNRKAHAAKIQARVQRLESRSQTQSSGDAGGEDPEAGESAEPVRKAREEYQDENTYANDFARRTGEATAKAEKKLRAVIDQKARMEARQAALLEVSANVVRGEGRVAPTQSTLGASQFRTQPNLDDEEEGQGGGDSVLNQVKSKAGEHDEHYETLTMRQRYGQNNDYTDFKRHIHDAVHQEDGENVPHYTTWFPAEPGDGDDVQMRGTSAGDDDDEEIQVSKDVLSTTCPLSMCEMKDVLTSPCNHNFEASAIKEHIQRSNEREEPDSSRRRNFGLGAQIVRCPVPACNERFKESDLRVDKVIRHKIRRIQERKRREEEGDDDEFDAKPRNRAFSVTDDDSRLSGGRQSTASVKIEHRSSMPPRHHNVENTPGPSITGLEIDDEMDEDYDEHHDG